MKTYMLFVGIILSFFALSITDIQEQSGNQILDGIGETGLIARYVLDGNTKDWSRNNLHAKIQNSKAEFIKDKLFGTVLSLPADSKAFVSIPGEAVIGAESLSITAWIYLRSEHDGQCFFDFGKDSNSHFYVAPMGTNDKEGCQTKIVTETGQDYSYDSPEVEANKWNHLAVVLDVPAKTMSTYVNGILVGKTNSIAIELEQLFDTNSGKNNLLYIGKSLGSENIYLNAKLHDFRVYRIPLSEKQITIICHNALNDVDAVVGIKIEHDADLQTFTKSTPQLYNQYLISVTDVEVETVVGNLPRIPRHVQGIYSNGIEGPEVRVLWPAPKDNSEVLKAGEYTVTGRIAGTYLKPKAIITVKQAKEPETPQRKLEVFNLDQVSLNTDIHAHDTKFIQNRDKFIKTNTL